MTRPVTGTHDKGHEHSIEAESGFSIQGITTPTGASQIPQILAGDEENLESKEITVGYEWGERGVGLTDLHWGEARSYLNSATNASSNAQPVDKLDDEMYWTSAPEDARADYKSTGLPNPNKLRVDGDIEVSVNYENGLLGFSVEFDTSYVDEDVDEEISEGNLKLSYGERYGTESETEIERMQSALEQLEKADRLLK